MTPQELEDLLNTVPQRPSIYPDDVVSYQHGAAESYRENWLGVPGHRALPHPLTRLSAIGLPVWVQALRMPRIQALLPAHRGGDFDAQTRRRFHFGHVLEHEAIMLMRAHGLKVTDTQTTLVFDEEHGVEGHCDGVLDVGGRRYVFDVKTMSDYSFTTYTGKGGPHDNGGYITQLACYAEVLQADGAFLLCYNKNTHMFRVVMLTGTEQAQKAKRAHRVIELLAGVHTLEDVDRLPKPPCIPATWYGREVPGLWVPHPSMQYHSERHLLWDIEQAKVHPKSRYRDTVAHTYDTIAEALEHGQQ